MLRRDARLFLAAAALRNFAYGFFAVGLALYLASRGLAPAAVGLVFSVALAGGAVSGILISHLAQRTGRRTVLIGTALLMAASGALLATSSTLLLLLLFAAMGTVSPSGQEVGPFTALEQAAIARLADSARHARVTVSAVATTSSPRTTSATTWMSASNSNRCLTAVRNMA